LDTRQGDAIDYALLYYALLRLAKIPVKVSAIPNELSPGGLYMEVNSNIPKLKMNQITVNPRLVTGEDLVGIPLYITSSNGNFAQAWYKGATICRKLKAKKNSAP
jgi:hypothetical protein